MIFKNFSLLIDDKDQPVSYVSGYNSEDGPSFTDIEDSEPVQITITGTYIRNETNSRAGIFAGKCFMIYLNFNELLNKLAQIDPDYTYKLSEYSGITDNEVWVMLDREEVEDLG